MLRRDIVWRRLLPFLVSGAVGVPLGVLLLLNSHPTLYLCGFGILLIGYSANALLRRQAVTTVANPAGDWFAGFMGGLVGGVAAFPGLSVVIWSAKRGWTKSEQRAVFQPFILVMQCVALAVIAMLAGTTPGLAAFDTTALMFVPVSMMGAWCGMAVFRKLTDRQFGAMTHVALIVSGLALVL